MRAFCKVWIEKDGQRVFSDGLADLLERVDQCGSINRAAAEMSMSYRQAWGMIRRVEERMNTRLLVRRVGGPSGGGASLSDDGAAWLSKYRRFRKQLDDLVDTAFGREFS